MIKETGDRVIVWHACTTNELQNLYKAQCSSGISKMILKVPIGQFMYHMNIECWLSALNTSNDLMCVSVHKIVSFALQSFRFKLNGSVVAFSLCLFNWRWSCVVCRLQCLIGLQSHLNISISIEETVSRGRQLGFLTCRYVEGRPRHRPIKRQINAFVINLIEMCHWKVLTKTKYSNKFVE